MIFHNICDLLLSVLYSDFCISHYQEETGHIISLQKPENSFFFQIQLMTKVWGLFRENLKDNE